MTPQELRNRTKKFAVDVIRFRHAALRNDDACRDIGSQLARAAGASGAGYRAACRALSRADFAYKLAKAVEEVDEAAFWLELLIDSELVPRQTVMPLWKEADELTRILVRSRETVQRKR